MNPQYETTFKTEVSLFTKMVKGTEIHFIFRCSSEAALPQSENDSLLQGSLALLFQGRVKTAGRFPAFCFLRAAIMEDEGNFVSFCHLLRTIIS